MGPFRTGDKPLLAGVAVYGSANLTVVALVAENVITPPWGILSFFALFGPIAWAAILVLSQFAAFFDDGGVAFGWLAFFLAALLVIIGGVFTADFMVRLA